MWARSIVIAKKEFKTRLFDIDMCKKYTVQSGDMKEMPEKGFKIPAIGGLCKINGKIEDSQSKILNSRIEKDGSLIAKVTKIIPKKIGNTVSVECDVSNENGKILAKYLLNPWTSCDPSISTALGKT